MFKKLGHVPTLEVNKMTELPEDASIEEQRDYFKEKAVDFASDCVKLIDKYNRDTTMMMFVIAEFVDNFEELLCELKLEHIVEKFRNDMSIKKVKNNG